VPALRSVNWKTSAPTQLPDSTDCTLSRVVTPTPSIRIPGLPPEANPFVELRQNTLGQTGLGGRKIEIRYGRAGRREVMAKGWTCGSKVPRTCACSWVCRASIATGADSGDATAIGTARMSKSDAAGVQPRTATVPVICVAAGGMQAPASGNGQPSIG